MPAAGVPLRTPVMGLRERVLGRAGVDVSLNLGAGKPLAVTVKEPGLPTEKPMLVILLVICGASFTVKVKFCVAGEPMPLAAVKTRL